MTALFALSTGFLAGLVGGFILFVAANEELKKKVKKDKEEASEE